MPPLVLVFGSNLVPSQLLDGFLSPTVRKERELVNKYKRRKLRKLTYHPGQPCKWSAKLPNQFAALLHDKGL